ncbi:485_t:CDS:10 [Entrophospora sp. SA101]|nr:485_t:CDS:10 [Entrophospora sp. SA101]
MKVENNYLKITSPELWSLDGFVDWCGSYDIFKGDKVKILDHIKKGLEKVKNNVLINEGIRQKATKLFKDFQQTWRSSQTITEYFKQLEIRYQTKQKLEVIESQKTIELAEIERMKVTQLWNNTESVAKIHQHVSDSFVEFSKEMTRIPKRILESDRESNPDKKQKPSALEDSDDELIIIDDDEEINNLTKDEMDIRNKMYKVLVARQNREKQSGKNHMTSICLNEQLTWLNVILTKQVSNKTEEFKQYVGQFTERVCNRVQIPTLVRNSFVSGRFDSYYYEDYDIAHQVLEHCATRLEAHISYESKSFNLERTFAIDTCWDSLSVNYVFLLLRIELTTPHTKHHKFDGLFKVIRTKLKNQVIIVVEFSSGRKASLTKEHDDHVKLCRNAMRILNAVLQTIPREKARIYLIQFVNSYLKIEYLICPLPSVYLLDCLVYTKVPETFNDFEKFAKDMADVLFTVKEINKIIHTAGSNNICTTSLEDTPKQDKKKVIKIIKKANDSYPESPCPGSPGSPLI